MAHVETHPARKGVTTVEAAIVFPLLVLLTFGLIEYGWMFLKAQQTTNAARAGVRLAVTPDAINDDVLARIDQLMSDAEMADTGYSITISTDDVTSVPPGDAITVAVQVPSAGIRLTGYPVPMPKKLRASVTMAKEGP